MSHTIDTQACDLDHFFLRVELFSETAERFARDAEVGG
jgi:hypothetical protein